jgi:ribosomal protein L7/L12
VTDVAEPGEDVKRALHAGRKLEAIKMLRVQRGLDLAEAKRQIDTYVAQHPELIRKHKHSEMNLIPLVVAAAIAIVAYLAFEYL